MAVDKKVFRYKFSDEIVELMQDFSKIHKFDTREIYNDNWNLFIQANKDTIEAEQERLNDLGYEGCIKNKMYKSTRYYFKKKNKSVETPDKEPVKRKKYVTVGKDILDSMYEHIKNNISKDNYKPDTGFNEFENVIKRSVPGYENLKSDDKSKYKKAYKNMYYRYKS
tara:strand:- start:481 stop:981 length:501 start_codon:yes stop_codon:yes gene_type:complete